ncbi:hypothetical protein I5M27_02580 [Adhaeribacter sp. BT258]|uniref:Uncharacterized protein n=1 Tax=Adhaeribacter terrigena TaxID=2793070 RepID=A0ABS1BXM4_9BACT|nr:hypothetical protein [Adhaeribacter terrigena]MBK0401852.1 hypothetical protein [Adhaeribacter terrigena]
MANHLKHIGKQLMVFALIASIFNIYALEIWCGLTMDGPRHEPISIGYHGTNAPAGTDYCPHQSDTDDHKGACEDHHSFFLTSLVDSGPHKINFSADDFQFILPDHLNIFGSHTNPLLTLSVRLFPDVGLKPKVPDIRIFICSLII